MLRQRLLELQWRQLNHDELYHREIARLSVGDRMKHMTLHLAKYLGHIAKACSNDEGADDEQHLVDIYIICLSAANTVNLDLAKGFIAYGEQELSVFDLGQRLSTAAASGRQNSRGFINDLAIRVGGLAKACESLDHVETFAFRERMQAGVQAVFELIVEECGRRGINLEEETARRQDGVRARHIFDAFLRPTLAAANDKAGLK